MFCPKHTGGCERPQSGLRLPLDTPQSRNFDQHGDSKQPPAETIFREGRITVDDFVAARTRHVLRHETLRADGDNIKARVSIYKYIYIFESFLEGRHERNVLR